MSPQDIQVTVLGCGTSSGVPVIQCRCKVCKSRDKRNSRLRASIWIQTQGKSILVDTSTDLRQQALQNKIPRIDAVLFTHPHADHISGIDELRSFNFIQRSRIPAYANQWTSEELRTKYPYIFNEFPYEGGGVPQLDLQTIDAAKGAIQVQGLDVLPLSVQHGSKECLGYRLGSFAYVTDCNLIPAHTLDRMRGLSLLILDCLRFEPHGTHFNLDQALAAIAEIRPKKTILTHLGHEFDYRQGKKMLPKSVHFAYDGLIVSSR